MSDTSRPSIVNELSEAELAELQDPDTWDWDSAERGTPHPEASAVVRLHLRGEDFWAVAAAARAAGQTLAAFIGQAAVERAYSADREGVVKPHSPRSRGR